MMRYDRREIEKQLAEVRRSLSFDELQLEELQVRIKQLRWKEALMIQLLVESQGGKPHRAPTDMLRPEFKGMRLSDVIETLLSQVQEPLTPKDIACQIYSTHSQDEFDRARSSVSAELRSNAKGPNPRWRKIGRSGYVALPSTQLAGEG